MTKKIVGSLSILLLLISVFPSIAFGSKICLNLNKDTSFVGDSIIASGTADSNTFISIKILDSKQNIIFFDAVKSSAEGNYSLTFKVPDVSEGTLNVIAGYGSNIASKTLTIISGSGPNESNNADLASLETDAGVLTPDFSPDVINYTVILPSGATVVPTITATLADTKATKLITTAADLSGNTTVQVTAEDGTVKTYTISFSVKQVIAIPADLSTLQTVELQVTATNKNFEMPVIDPDDLANLEIKMDVPTGIEGASISVPISSMGDQKSATLPKMTITSTAAKVDIPSGTTINAPAGWDGTINAPTVKANNTVTITPEAGKTATVNAVIEVGFKDIPLTFNKAVRILIPGQAGNLAGYYRAGTFTPITRMLTEDTQTTADNEIPTGAEAKKDVGSDLVIWTKHFTRFVGYTLVDECFIATAAFGSKFEPSVKLLRAFRDQFLLTNTLGTAFVDFYYRNSPPIANYIAHNEILKAGVRGLLMPVVGVVYLMFHPALAAICLGLILLSIVVYKLRKRKAILY